MSNRNNFANLDGKNYRIEENVRTFQPPKQVKNLNGKPVGFVDKDDFDEFEDKPVKQEEQKQTPTQAPESPKKSKAGRKSRKKEQEKLHASLEMVSKKKVLHEAEILEITYKSLDKNLLRDLLVKQLLTAYEINEDTAPSILNFLWEEASILNGNKNYISSLREVSESLKLSYPSVQKVIKKLTEKEIIVKNKHGYYFSNLLESFFESLTVNQQIVLTFEELEEEQLEAIDKEGHVNEEMAN